ncbi:MAG: hypothetical protein IPM07_14330 [Anaerolineales bacterium]|nr:hypothetical protein [Anaerolineales bacterium]
MTNGGPGSRFPIRSSCTSIKTAWRYYPVGYGGQQFCQLFMLVIVLMQVRLIGSKKNIRGVPRCGQDAEGLTGGMLSGYGLLLLLTFLILFPVIWIIAQSFMQEARSIGAITFIPLATFRTTPTCSPIDRPPRPAHRGWLFATAPCSNVRHRADLTVASMPQTMPLPALNFREDLLLYLFGASLLIPSQITFIPSFLIVRPWRIDTYHLPIWPPIAYFFGVFFLRQFFLTIPRL